LPSPTLVVSGGFARSFSALEVRGLARYGLPIVEETTETGYSESVRRDFGALELRACYGIGADVRLSACAGGELGAVRISRRVAENGIDVDEDGVTPRLSGVLSALLRHQGGVVEPELEVSGSALAAGGQEAASRVALRVSAGAAVEF
jgi:predicted PhzF superfamily epimerase YddE/YHI9